VLNDVNIDLAPPKNEVVTKGNQQPYTLGLKKIALEM